MKIWVDADACPKVIKEILFRAAERTSVPVTLVANQYLTIPPSPHIDMLQVGDGFDVADARIVKLCQAGDLVVTADIPLADLVIKEGAFALTPRGELYDSGNIGPVLSMRDFMDVMRGSLLEQGSGGPSAFSQKDRQKFAAALDRFLTTRPARS